MNIPMSSPDLTDAEIGAVNRVLQTPHLSIGSQIEAFERTFASYLGVAHAVGVSSGTAALHLAVIAAGVGEGDLVITTPFSFIASANCILYERGIPIFVDIDPQTLNVDPELLAAAADDLLRGGDAAKRWLPPALRHSQSRTHQLKAILPVDAFGQPADMDRIVGVARKHGLTVIEDACEAIGAEYKGRKAGTLGDVGTFAFYPNKQMTTGEGGMIFANRDDWDALFRSLRNQGRDIFDAWLDHSRLGYNYRLDEMSAALGLAQLGRIEELLTKRERVAQMYNERLGRLAGVSVPHVAATTSRSSWFVYVVRLAAGINRNQVMADLQEQGIPSRPYFSCIHLQPFYRRLYGFKPGDFEAAERAANSTLALPFHGKMSEAEVAHVCDALSGIIERQLQ
jgi:perosamine synthetase